MERASWQHPGMNISSFCHINKTQRGPDSTTGWHAGFFQWSHVNRFILKARAMQLLQISPPILNINFSSGP